MNFFEDCILLSGDGIVKTKYSVSMWFCLLCLLVIDECAFLTVMSISSHRQALNIGEMVSHHLD